MPVNCTDEPKPFFTSRLPTKIARSSRDRDPFDESHLNHSCGDKLETELADDHTFENKLPSGPLNLIFYIIQQSIMVKPIPDNIKEVLSQLTGPQQVAIRGYIATLRSEIKALEEEVLTAADADPHAHYHGHEKCTVDHGHADHDDDEQHKHKEHHEHKHEHNEHCDHKEHHEHKHEHNEHCDHKEHHEHKHEHNEHCDHKSHEHKHHDHEDEHQADDVPAWKKKALEADPSSAPFGGSWNTESNTSASKESNKMEE
jgi:hypothetical protein